jgi:hypothetical protein
MTAYSEYLAEPKTSIMLWLTGLLSVTATLSTIKLMTVNYKHMTTIQAFTLTLVLVIIPTLFLNLLKSVRTARQYLAGTSRNSVLQRLLGKSIASHCASVLVTYIVILVLMALLLQAGSRARQSRRSSAELSICT